MSRGVKTWLSALAALIFVVGVFFVLAYRVELTDRLKLLGYTAPAEVVALADASAMEGRGRDLFYVSEPKVQDRELFNINCTDTGEESLVLGCYKQQRIYIYNVTDERLNGVKEVTAAHEMLHAAYERLSGDERKRVDELLVKQIAKMSDPRLAELIELYNREEPGQLANEMHSILGTEYDNLSVELEEYYEQYFSNRATVVQLASNYSSVFTESQNRIENHDNRLASLKKQIDDNSLRLDRLKDDLDSFAAQLDALRDSDPVAYNAAVPTYNSDVRAYNNLASSTRSLVNEYNALVETRNQELAAQNDLYHSLDSNYQTVGTD